MSKMNAIPHEVAINDLGDLVKVVNENEQGVVKGFTYLDKQVRKLKGKLIFGRVVGLIFAGYVFYKFQDQDLKYEALNKDIKRVKEESEKE